MNKTKKMNFSSYYIFLSIIGIAIIGEILLFSFEFISLFAFLISIVISVLMFTITIIALVANKRKKVQKINILSEKIIITDQDIIDLYNRAGIPVIYDEEGKIKNIFELLGLKVIYDENGNRLQTIYEQLGIVPRFKKDGKEVPTFLVIKNRVNGLVKPAKTTGSLKRALTDEQKEELLLRQMLAQKLEESEKSGDTKKAKVIKKVIQQRKKESESTSKKEGYTKTAKPVKPSSLPKVKDSKYKLVVKGLFSPGVTKVPYRQISVSPVKDTKETDKKKSFGFSLVLDTTKTSSEDKKVVESKKIQSITTKPIPTEQKLPQNKKTTENSNKIITVETIALQVPKPIENNNPKPQDDDKLFFSFCSENINVGTGLFEEKQNLKLPNNEKPKEPILGLLKNEKLNKNPENVSNERIN